MFDDHKNEEPGWREYWQSGQDRNVLIKARKEKEYQEYLKYQKQLEEEEKRYKPHILIRICFFLFGILFMLMILAAYLYFFKK